MGQLGLGPRLPMWEQIGGGGAGGKCGGSLSQQRE